MNRPRVVITGLGAITPLGSSVSQFWQGLLSGQSGVRRITQFDASHLPCQIAGEIPDFVVEDYIERREARRIPRSAQIALAAAIQAMQDSGFRDSAPNAERTAVVFGTGIGGIDQADKGIQILRTKGYERVNPFTLPTSIPNLSAFIISERFQCLGPNLTLTSSCATSTLAIGEAAELIRRGSADVVICGGTESLICDFSIAGFYAMRALPTNYNDRPTQASRPFDARREGFVLSEGAATLILERLEHALERKAHIYAEVVGYASSADGRHLAAPDPSASGPVRAMRWALENAGLTPKEVDYINAHGTSTLLNDLIETRAIKQVFGEDAYRIPISSTKSMLGHPMGASGALEAIVCVLTIHHGCIHPTINYETPDPECDLDYVPGTARQMQVNVALSNSFGLGGQNACLVIQRFHHTNPNPEE